MYRWSFCQEASLARVVGAEFRHRLKQSSGDGLPVEMFDYMRSSLFSHVFPPLLIIYQQGKTSGHFARASRWH